MVDIEPVEVEQQPKASEDTADQAEPEPKPSEERLLDAAAIEEAAKTITRPTARAHLESLAQKLRRDAAALKRVEASRAKMEAASLGNGGESAAAATASASTPAPASVASASASASAPPVPKPAPAPMAPPAVPVSASYSPIDRFSFDAGGYNSDRVTLYIPLPGVGSIPRDRITCDFTPTSFDLIVRDHGGKSYRLFKDNLEKDIDTSTCKYIVKADKIIVRLGKCKGEYGSYDHWQNLTAKKPKKKTADGKSAPDNPSESIMNLMKEMYDEGDDKMKKMIGETMLKQRTGQLDKSFDKDNYGLDGMGDMDEDF